MNHHLKNIIISLDMCRPSDEIIAFMQANPRMAVITSRRYKQKYLYNGIQEGRIIIWKPGFNDKNLDIETRGRRSIFIDSAIIEDLLVEMFLNREEINKLNSDLTKARNACREAHDHKQKTAARITELERKLEDALRNQHTHIHYHNSPPQLILHT